jgi:two-component system, OmpR family, sensor kinase
MKFLHSIRWQLQFWHGLLLAIVLAGFGFTAWRLQRATQLQRVDQELEQRVSVIAGAMRRGGGVPGRPPQDRPPRPPEPPELRLSAHDLILFDGASGVGFYYAVWLPGGRELSRSASVPPTVPRPEREDGRRDARSRGTLREYFHFTPSGECVLVGRDIQDELAGVRRFAWILAGAGVVVLALGLAGGWWISTRALRPIGDISAAAARIAKGDLAQRIQTSDTSGELGGLAGVLNETFSRLQASFARQAQFTADASHELRTPVSVVLTQTQTALARERPAAEYRESLAACQRAAQRMRRLTESLLMLARLDSGEAAATREPCDLEQIAYEAVELLRSLAQEQNITLQVESTPSRCEGNKEQLGQVAANLVSNAIYYNRPGGSVQVKVACEFGIGILVVKDTGQGIAPEDLPHICERFYRVDKARSKAAGRTGLGLAITKAIVEAHGGTIQVVSELGHGSTFTIRLPAQPVPAEAVRASA